MSTTVGLEIDRIFNEVGSPDLLHSFFSTISFHLEKGRWGARFPELVNQLYQGRLEPANAEKAYKDALTIKEELAGFPPDRVVWDIANIALKPPHGDQVAKGVTSLANYHRTSTNRVLMDLLIECLEYQTQCKKPLTVTTRTQLYKQV